MDEQTGTCSNGACRCVWQTESASPMPQLLLCEIPHGLRIFMCLISRCLEDSVNASRVDDTASKHKIRFTVWSDLRERRGVHARLRRSWSTMIALQVEHNLPRTFGYQIGREMLGIVMPDVALTVAAAAMTAQ